MKSCRIEKNICVVGDLQEQSDLTYMDSCKNKGFLTSNSLQQPTHPLSPYPSLSISGNMVVWDMSPPSSQFAGFPDKVAVPCPNTLSLDSLACHLVRSMSLDLVIQSHSYFTGEEAKTQKTEFRPDWNHKTLFTPPSYGKSEASCPGLVMNSSSQVVPKVNNFPKAFNQHPDIAISGERGGRKVG